MCLDHAFWAFLCTTFSTTKLLIQHYLVLTGTSTATDIVLVTLFFFFFIRIKFKPYFNNGE